MADGTNVRSRTHAEVSLERASDSPASGASPAQEGPRGGFVDRYVFPDGEHVPIDEALREARAAGFEIVDVESLRPHNALTLAAWVRRLEARWEEAVAAAAMRSPGRGAST